MIRPFITAWVQMYMLLQMGPLLRLGPVTTLVLSTHAISSYSESVNHISINH